MNKFKCGDRIDIQIKFENGLPSGHQLLAVICKGKTKVITFRQNNGITTTDQKVFNIVLLPATTSNLTPGAYYIELALYTADHQQERVSANHAEFMMYDSIGGKEALI